MECTALHISRQEGDGHSGSTSKVLAHQTCLEAHMRARRTAASTDPRARGDGGRGNSSGHLACTRMPDDNLECMYRTMLDAYGS